MASSLGSGVPRDAESKLEQLKELFSSDFQFWARYPEAYEVLFDEQAALGLPLPSFGIRIFHNAPQVALREPEAHEEGGDEGSGDAFSVNPLPISSTGLMLARAGRQEGLPETELLPPLYREILESPDDRGYLREILLEILGREELPRVLASLEHPLEEDLAVRITDLRLADNLDPSLLKERLERVLESLPRPITTVGVVRWKHQTLRELTEPIKQAFGDLETGIIVVSFAAAALLLFLDLRMLNLNNEQSRGLAWKIADLAELVNKLMKRLDTYVGSLGKLLANRSKGDRSRSADMHLVALARYRMGYGEKNVAKWLGINPYESKSNEGTKNWQPYLFKRLARGVEIEKERFPWAAAVFANQDDPRVTRIARQAFDADARGYLTEWLQDTELFDPLGTDESLPADMGEAIRSDPPSERGQQLLMAYIQLGACLEHGIDPTP